MLVADFVDELIVMTKELGGSDIHFKPTRNNVLIYLRVGEKLIEHQLLELDYYSRILRYIKYKCNLELGTSKIPLDGAYSIIVEKIEIFARVSTIPLISNESLVIRILMENNNVPLQQLAYDPPQIELIYQTIVNNNGLFIFTGPTGSGKSTSMYSILKQAVTNEKIKVICIEDPVEIIEEGLTQIQINEDIGLTYEQGIKACLRHDPDIIMIGEIRDEQTAKSVFRAALTGHTVISTMHTKNNYGVIQRFLDFGFQISEIQSVLIGITNQRLVYDQQWKSYFDIVVGDDIEELIRAPYHRDLTKELSELNVK